MSDKPKGQNCPFSHLFRSGINRTKSISDLALRTVGRRLFVRVIYAVVVAGLAVSGTAPRGYFLSRGGTPSTHRAQLKAAVHARVSHAYGKLPLYFEINRGQTDRTVKFLSRSARHTLFLTSNEAVLVVPSAQRGPTPYVAGRLHPRSRSGGDHVSQHANFETEKPMPQSATVLRMKFAGANPRPRITPRAELPAKVNYFIGKDPKQWHTKVPTYAKVEYEQIYPGIDLTYYSNQGQLEYDFVIRPGADPNAIAVDFQGADKLELDADGNLVLHTSAGAIRQRKPLAYQDLNGIRREVTSSYVLRTARQIGFQVANYDASRPVVIDPALFYSTYLGGSDFDSTFGIAADAGGNAYLTGNTFSLNFPTTSGAFDTSFNGSQDAFVAKIDPTGSVLIYSSYLGGLNDENGAGITVDGAGNVFATGQTDSPTFPTTAGPPLQGDRSDVYVTKIDPTGSVLIYSTLLGGSARDVASDIATDVAGNAYVTGFTGSGDFPTTPLAFQTTYGGDEDAFVTKINPAGSGLVYSTYLGGAGFDAGFGIEVDSTGSAHVGGATFSTSFPTTAGAFQAALRGSADAFAAKMNLTGTGLVYSTYLGGDGTDNGESIGIDISGNAYLTGFTDSDNFPTVTGAFQSNRDGGSMDAFVTKMNPTGSGLVYSTYLGGDLDDEGVGIAVDALNNAYVTGVTSSTNFPTTAGAFQTSRGGNFDAFVTKMNSMGSGLVYSSYLGGSLDDFGYRIALDTLPNPNAYVSGDTESTNFPTTVGAFQFSLGGIVDGFVAKIADVVLPPGQTAGRVTGGGTINVVGGIGTLSFIVRRQADTAAVNGRLQYVNHASGARVRSEVINSLTIFGNTATFGGTCTTDGAPCTFTVNVMDNGEPGSTDTFTISVSGGPTEGGTLRSGNILIRQ